MVNVVRLKGELHKNKMKLHAVRLSLFARLDQRLLHEFALRIEILIGPSLVGQLS